MYPVRPGAGAMPLEEILNDMYAATGLPLIDGPPKPQRPPADWSRDPDFPNAVARGAKLRKTLAPFAPRPLLDMLVLGRIMGTYPDPRQSAGQSSTTSRAAERMGLHASAVPDSRPHTSKTQAELELLRKNHPELVAAEAHLDEESKPQGWLDWLFDTGRESGLLAYSNTSDPNAPLLIKPQHSVKGPEGYYDVIPAPRSRVYPSIPGYELELIEHNHPFPTWSFRWHNAHDPLPSPADQDIAYKNPSAFSVIRRAGDKINPNVYYGPRARY